MKGRYSVPLRVAAVGATSAVAMMAAFPAAGADGDVQVVNTETVQVYTDAVGAVETKRIYEQLSFTGSGSVDVRNPIATDGLRNLDGFGGFDVEDGEQITTMTVDGEERLRSVSDYTGDLPLEVGVRYFLDGQAIEPKDVVGESGRLEVQYTVKNVTGAPQEVTFDDGKGGTVTKTVEVPIPLVGSLTTTVPSNFTDVESGQANMAGDGKGGTRLSFTMTLFPPIGSDTAEFGYTANITDGVIPRASATVLPVNPLESPSFKSAGESYQGGADTGIELTAGASEIDANLLRLRDGAGELLAGLIQLRDGAIQLEAGLVGEAAPGAARLSDGAAELNSGLGQLDDGANKLADGAGTASAGSGKLADGATRLSGGLNKLDGGVGDLSSGAKRLAAGQQGLEDGLTTLYQAVDMLPASVQKQLASNADYQKLLGALDAIIAGVGNATDVTNPATGQPATLLGGLNAIKYGLTNPMATDAACEAKDATRCGATDALDLIVKKLNGALLGPASADGTVAKLKATILSIEATCGANPVCVGTVRAVADGVEDNQIASLTELRDSITTVSGGVKTNITNPGAGLDRLKAALSTGDPTQCATAPCGIKQAAQAVRAGVPILVNELVKSIEAQILEGLGKPTKNCDPEATLRCAAAALADGGEDLIEGVNTLVSGVEQLNAGGMELSAGAGELADGLGQLDDGANQLADGTGKAADGSTQLADGAGQLATGLGDAAAGSGQLAGGLGTAADAAPQLEDGAQRLSTEGTSKLVEAGEATAQNYGELYAVIEAGSERAQAEKMVFGAPEGAMGLAAYSFEIKGEDGEGGRNLTRGLGGLALLGAGAAAFGLRRRLI